jgi:hypothetical protein
MILIIALFIAGAGLFFWSEQLKKQQRDRIHQRWLGLPEVSKYNQRPHRLNSSDHADDNPRMPPNRYSQKSASY